MQLETAIALSEAIRGQIELLWTVSIALAAALAVVVRGYVGPNEKGGDPPVPCCVWVLICTFAGITIISLVSGYLAANGLVSLIEKAGMNVERSNVGSLMKTIEIFSLIQAVFVLLQVVFLLIIFVRDPRARRAIFNASTPGR